MTACRSPSCTTLTGVIFDGVFWCDEIDIAPVRALLDGDGGTTIASLRTFQFQFHVHELAGPKPVLLVREGAFDFVGARRLVDLVIDDEQRAIAYCFAAGDGLKLNRPGGSKHRSRRTRCFPEA